MTTIRVTEFQAQALGIYIFDPAHHEDEFPGTLTGNRLVITDVERARELLTQAANSAGNDRDARMEVAILAVCRRIPCSAYRPCSVVVASERT